MDPPDTVPDTVQDTVPWTRTERLAGSVLARSGPALAGFVALTGLLAAVLVPVHGWRPVVVVPLLVVLCGLLLPLVRYVPARPVPAWTTAACLAIATCHGLWAALTHAEHVVLRRDAGSYALYTQWISTHHGLQIPSQVDAFGGAAALADPAFRLASPAFFEVASSSGAQIVPQFLLGAPAVFSLGWWTTGSWAGVFVVPAIVSACALLAVAGLTTKLCGARWAVLVTASLAICQPILHAARSTYSEPAAMLLVAAAAGLLVDAVRAGNPDPGQVYEPRLTARLSARLALAAGLGFGLAGLVRVDALREVSLLLPVAAVLALRGHPAARPLAVGALGGTAVSAVPAVLLSRPYLGGIAGSLVPLVGLGVVLGLGSLVAVAWGPAIGRLLPRIPRLPQLVTVLVLLVGVVLAGRPLWLTVRQSAADPGSRVVAGLQLRQGLTVDGGRTYAEQSVNWLNWYVGPVVLVAALLLFAGLAGASVRWWRRPSGPTGAGLTGAGPTGAGPSGAVPPWFGPAFVALGSVVLTLYRPGITPDHPWADRRMVPVVIPALVIGAGAVLAWAGRTARRHWSAPVLIGVLAAGAVAMLLPAWLATAPLAGPTGETERGEPAAVAAVCAALKPGDAVIAVDSRGSNEWPQLIRGVCGLPSASVKADLAGTPAAAAVIAARVTAAGHRPVLLAASTDGVGILDAMELSPDQVVDLRTTEDQHLLERRPDAVDQLAVQVWLAPYSS